MGKLPECNHCKRYSHRAYLICAIHPTGPNGDDCLDFAPNAAAAMQQDWQPVGGSFYNWELVPDVSHFLTRDERLELLATHPLFTGQCPRCKMSMNPTDPPQVHWDCDRCNWKDDTL